MQQSPPQIDLPTMAPLWRALPGLVLLLGLALSALLYVRTDEQQDQQHRAFFNSEVRKITSLLESRIGTYEQLLRGVAALYRTEAAVSPQQFRQFVHLQGIGTLYTGVQGVGYVKRLRPEELAAHEKAMRQQGHPAYSVYPPGPRSIYTAIVLLEPELGRNLRAIGYDMYSDAVRREAMDRATERGEMSLSGKVRLVQENGINEQAGFLIYFPIYRTGQPTTTAEERQRQLAGWVYAPFRMNDFMNALLGDQAGDLLLDIYDGTQMNPASLMYTMQSGSDDKRHRHETVRTLALMGRTWTLHIRASDLLLSQLDHRLPLVVGSGAASLSLVLAALVWALVSARQRAEQTARRLNQALVVEHARLAAILEGTRVGTWEWNVQTGETTFNDEWARLIGYELAELAPTSIATWARLTHPDDLTKSEQLLQQHFNGDLAYYDCEVRMRHKNGHWIWVQDRGKVASRTPDGKPLMMYGTHQDISQHKQQEEIYRHGAHHDPLTDLPNRALLGDRLAQALQLAVREHTRLALMYMDLDGFKRVNDEHGHEAGDVVLQTLARRIQRCIRASDTLARIGGDEFVVLLQDVHDELAALQLAEKFNAEVRRPIPLPDGGEGHVSLSIGIAVYPQHGTSADELSEHADQAMYQVKKGGKNAARVYRTT